jgi:hypothetical protein
MFFFFLALFTGILAIAGGWGSAPSDVDEIPFAIVEGTVVRGIEEDGYVAGSGFEYGMLETGGAILGSDDILFNAGPPADNVFLGDTILGRATGVTGVGRENVVVVEGGGVGVGVGVGVVVGEVGVAGGLKVGSGEVSRVGKIVSGLIEAGGGGMAKLVSTGVDLEKLDAGNA